MNDANELSTFNKDIYPRFKDKIIKWLNQKHSSIEIILDLRITLYNNSIQSHLKG